MAVTAVLRASSASSASIASSRPSARMFLTSATEAARRISRSLSRIAWSISALTAMISWSSPRCSSVSSFCRPACPLAAVALVVADFFRLRCLFSQSTLGRHHRRDVGELKAEDRHAGVELRMYCTLQLVAISSDWVSANVRMRWHSAMASA
jgi:hypothetical protein